MRPLARPRILLVLVVFPISSSLGAAPGSDDDLGAQLRLLAPANRMNAPFGVLVTMRSNRPRIITGHLEILFRQNRSTVGRYRSPEWTLAPGEQSYRLLIPPLADVFSMGMLAELRFHIASEDATIELGSRPLPSAGVLTRSMTILSCASAAESDTLLASLKFESLHPQLVKMRSAASHVVTEQPGDLPARALEYCAFDLVFLDAKGFSMLEKEQLEAIANWVEAGGSLLVAATRGVSSAQLAFLNRLGVASGEGDEAAFHVGDRGRLDADARLLEGDVLRLWPGLGRTAVFFRMPGADELPSTSWRGVVAFLWKLRAKIEARIRARGKPRESADHLDFSPRAMNTEGLLLQAFVPEGFRPLPFGLIFLVLFVFFLTVGPLEVLIVGRARRHRLTWILTPALSLGFTLLTISLAEYYMGSVDARKSLTVCDLGSGGRLLRQNRYEILLSGQERRVTREVTGGLVSVMSRHELDPGARLTSASRFEEAPLYLGTVPRSYRVQQRVGKWSPQLVRTFSMGGEIDTDLPTLNWDEVGPSVFRSRSKLKQLKTILAGEDFGGSIHLFHRDRALRISGRISESWRPIVRPACVRMPEGMFALVSRISPNGGGSFEDLPIVDPTDSREWLLVITVPRGDDLIMLRRLYRGGRR